MIRAPRARRVRQDRRGLRASRGHPGRRACKVYLGPPVRVALRVQPENGAMLDHVVNRDHKVT